jgi:hypothetical protein
MRRGANPTRATSISNHFRNMYGVPEFLELSRPCTGKRAHGNERDCCAQARESSRRSASKYDVRCNDCHYAYKRCEPAFPAYRPPSPTDPLRSKPRALRYHLISLMTSRSPAIVTSTGQQPLSRPRNAAHGPRRTRARKLWSAIRRGRAGRPAARSPALPVPSQYRR